MNSNKNEHMKLSASAQKNMRSTLKAVWAAVFVVAGAVALLLGAPSFKASLSTFQAWWLKGNIRGVGGDSFSNKGSAHTPTFSWLDSKGRFVMTDYLHAKPFASFLPGISGTMGIPIWCFYTNRGQAVAGFGITDKDYSIMQFEPANQAWYQVQWRGFRTFLQGERNQQSWYYEPFSADQAQTFQSTVKPIAQSATKMYTGMNEVEIEEINVELGLQANVLYFNIPNDDFGALVRRVTFTNLDQFQPLQLQFLDGLTEIIPYGSDESALKTKSRTLEAWMKVYGIQSDPTLPFFHLETGHLDTEVVELILFGNFAVSFLEDNSSVTNGQYERLKYVVDPETVFGNNTAFTHPTQLNKYSVLKLFDQQQVYEAKTPCAFAGGALTIDPGSNVTIVTVMGMASSLDRFQSYIVPKITQQGYIREKQAEAAQLAQELTKKVAVKSNNPIFDGYVRQNFMDNFLRGGLPVLLGTQNESNSDSAAKPVYVFSRIHGDLERDYNYFVLPPTFFSNGPGNFRDVMQNRRNDVLIEPDIGDFNVRQFFSLLTADGYNPLTVDAAKFTIPDSLKLQSLVNEVTSPTDQSSQGNLTIILSPKLGFMPGDVLTALKANNVKLTVPVEDLLAKIAAAASQTFQATFSQGFWTDHWTYGLDLLYGYLMVFPEQEESLLWENGTVPTYLAPNAVMPRQSKYVLLNGSPRQIGSCQPDTEKIAALNPVGGILTVDSMWQKNQQGQIMRMPLISKALLLAVVKFASLDPFGMGLEMEAGKPGWLDSLNGLPSFFGSSMPETFELMDLISYLQAVIMRFQRPVQVPSEVFDLLSVIQTQLNKYPTVPNDFVYWDAVYTAKERYREETKVTFVGTLVPVDYTQLNAYLAGMLAKLQAGVKKAVALNGGLTPTYFMWRPTSWELLDTVSTGGLKNVKVNGFQPEVLPLFLEGPTRMLKVLPDQDSKRKLYKQVKSSTLFDSKLGMYKISSSLKTLSPDLGRVAAFFPGWLENESIWLHMAYKFYLELVRAGLFEEFWADAQTGLVPFMDPSRYGRSTFEASSFLVSSAHPDESLWGTGFVSRLSGSTAEFLSIWTVLTVGSNPFQLNYKQEIVLVIKPSLPGWLFSSDGTLSFTFLGSIQVVIHNDKRVDTWNQNMVVTHILLHYVREVVGQPNPLEISGALLSGKFAKDIRSRQVSMIEYFYVKVGDK